MRKGAKVGVVLAVALCLSAQPASAGWRGAPIVPKLGKKVRARSAATLSDGRARGNRDDVFAKVGDSITESGSFLQDLACQAPEWGAWRELRKTAAHFGRRTFPGGYTSVWCGVANSYSRASLSAVAGWSAAHAIGPLEEPRAACEGGLAHPLDCELALLRPAVALIMYGTNDMQLTSLTRFRANLTTVVKRTRAAGTIPVLSTIPVRTDSPSLTVKVPAFNETIASVARGQRVPLWNYWLQMTRDAVANGLASDGLHPSIACPPCDSLDFRASGLEHGYNQRNLGALRVLDRIKRVLLNRAR
ncbi:MAG: SGNH/GDSL hydrolase family protein [Solirubrobacterales bacterium]|nr:SGNH/GDSL hydrolase family protein [Solirubrobacterales bacterium]